MTQPSSGSKQTRSASRTSPREPEDPRLQKWMERFRREAKSSLRWTVFKVYAELFLLHGLLLLLLILIFAI